MYSMCSLIKYELDKIWRRRDYILAVGALLFLNLFLLWYTNLPDDVSPPLSAYKAFQNEINGMTEQEKGEYISSLKETLDNMAFVQEVLSIQQLSGEMREYFLKQTLESRPGIFEQYQESFETGDYLRFTDSFYQEKALVDELYEEWRKVSSYEDYLNSIQENQDILENISIFNGHNPDSQNSDNRNGSEGKTETFASRNIAKSAEDYRKLMESMKCSSTVRSLSTDNSLSMLCWIPGKPLVSAMESVWTDLLLLLSVFLFSGSLIFQEKEKRLFYVTRCTRRGIYPCIMSKLAALFLHCIFIPFLLYGANLLFFGITAGLGSMEGFLGAPIQSISSYMESSFSITVGQYILLSLLTKGAALFSIASILTAFCILADNIFFPYGATGILCGLSFMLYLLFPAGMKLSAVKYLNLAGVMRTENLYGAYLNFNLFEYPVSRTGLSWILLILLTLMGIVLCLLSFGYGRNLSLRETNSLLKKAPFAFRCFGRKLHAGLLRHEYYKIMITNKALPILLIFVIFIGYNELTREYGISVKEQYYQNICLQLEGALTPEKEALILAEKVRFQEAFDNINRIEQMVADGEISLAAGEDLKAPWYAVTAFYPSFGRVWQQYQRNLEKGGGFIYDTGYLYLIGANNADFAVNLLLLTFCSIFAFGNCLAMEYKSGAWQLLNTAKEGKRKVFARKIRLCLLTASVVSLAPFVSRAVNLAARFPMHGLGFPADNIPYCSSFFLSGIPVAFFLLSHILSQALSLVIITLGVLLLSGWRKDYVQGVFFSILIFAVPLILKLLGFDFAGWFSVYPLYSWTGRL